MNIKLINGLPIISFKLHHSGKIVLLENVLLDTGCATTIFDTDSVEPIDLNIDFIHGRSVRMYGVGGHSELCYQQVVSKLAIENLILDNFTIQLGITKESYGFDAILGIDVLTYFGLNIDFKNFKVTT